MISVVAVAGKLSERQHKPRHPCLSHFALHQAKARESALSLPPTLFKRRGFFLPRYSYPPQQCGRYECVPPLGKVSKILLRKQTAADSAHKSPPTMSFLHNHQREAPKYCCQNVFSGRPLEIYRWKMSPQLMLYFMENSFVVRSLHSEEIEISCLGYGELTELFFE